MFHEYLTTRRLFMGETEFETMRHVREARVEPPSSLSPLVPPELDEIVLKMLARRPEDRFQSCEEVVLALEPLQSHLEGNAAALCRFLAGLGPIRGNDKKPSRAPQQERQPTLMHGETRRMPDTPSSGRPGWLIASSAAALVLVATVWIAHRARTPSVATVPAPTEMIAAAPSPRVTALAPPVAKPEAAEVHLSVGGPRGAEVLIEGKLVGMLPLDLRLPRVAAERHLLVRHPGFRPWSRTIAGDLDVRLQAPLIRNRAPAAPMKRAAPASIVKDPFEGQ
jgi:hypothetical protein